MVIKEILNTPVLEGEHSTHISELEELLFDGYVMNWEIWDKVNKDKLIHVYTVKHEKYEQYGERNLKVGYITFKHLPVAVWVLGKDGGELFPVKRNNLIILRSYLSSLTDKTHIYEQDFNIESVNGYGLN